MKKLVLFSGLVATSFMLNAQSTSVPPFQWAKGTGSTGNERANKNISDGKGFTYVIGTFEGTVDFDPGAGVVNLSSTGQTDTYIQKFRPNGQLVWAKRLGGTLKDNGTAIALDYNKNVYIGGTFEGTVDLNPNGGVLNKTATTGSSDVFLVKLDSNGFFYWGHSFGGTNLETVTAIKIDNSSNVNVVGGFKGTVDFNPGTAVFNVTSKLNGSTSTTDAYVLRLNSGGVFTWVKTIQGLGEISITGVEAWNSSELFCSGTFSGTADFDPNTGVSNLTSAGQTDAFLLKLSSAGSLVWAKRIGANHIDVGNDIALDVQQNVYIIGTWSANAGVQLDVDPGPGVVNKTGTSINNLYVISLDKYGNYRWNYTVSATGYSPRYVFGLGIDVEICGNIYFTGLVQVGADFDPTSGVNFLESTNSSTPGAVIGKLNVNGTYLGAGVITKSWSTIIPTSITTDYYGNAYVCGEYTGKDMDFNMSSTGVSTLTSSGWVLGATNKTDAFHAKYGPYSMNNLTGPQSGGNSSSRESDLTSEIITEESSILLFPNPAVDFLNIQTQNQGVLEIYSISGQLILSEVINAGTTQKDITNIPSGSYITRFITNIGVQTSKIVIGD